MREPLIVPERFFDEDFLNEAADALDNAPRQGAAEDKPEGSRFVTFSDTLLIALSKRFRQIAERLKEHAG